MPFALKKTRGLKPWQPGQSGNPKGRPVGSRNKLATLVFDEALASFEKRTAQKQRRLIRRGQK